MYVLYDVENRVIIVSKFSCVKLVSGWTLCGLLGPRSGLVWLCRFV